MMNNSTEYIFNKKFFVYKIKTKRDSVGKI